MAQLRAPHRRPNVYIHSEFKSHPFCDDTMGRPDHYKLWEKNAMCMAMEAVAQGQSVRRAAEEYGVPRSTLHDRVTGKVQHGSRSGPRKYLSTLEEEQLVSHLINCSSIGYGKTRKETLAIVQATVDKKGIDTQVSFSWLKSLMKRHPELTLKAGESVSKARQIGASIENLEKYFDLLEETLHENDLLHRPCQIFNTDETGVPLDVKPVKVFGAVSQKSFYSVTTGNKKQITVLACTSAGGMCLPPMIIFNRKGLGEGMDEGTIPGTLFAFSPKGWMDAELFENWFFHHFLSYAPPVRPLLLLLDGHSSHYSPYFVNKAAEEKVIVFCLPPNSTHRTQPLDKGPFSPLKQYWREECHNFMSTNPGKVITHYQFGSIFSKAWRRAMTPSNIMAGFKVTGVYPVNRYAVIPHDSGMKQSLCERTGLQYIPFYTPRKLRRLPLPSVSSELESESEDVIQGPSSQYDSPTIDDEAPPFTQEEIARYSRRYEEGYDIKTDQRYNQWLSTHVPQIPAPQTAIAPFLKLPEVKYPETSQHRPSARIITSVEHRLKLMEKQRQKQEDLERKAFNRAERERKQKEKKEKLEEKMRKTALKKRVQLPDNKSLSEPESEDHRTYVRETMGTSDVSESESEDHFILVRGTKTVSELESEDNSRPVRGTKGASKVLSESGDNSRPVRGTKGTSKVLSESEDNGRPVRGTKGTSKVLSEDNSRPVRGTKGTSKVLSESEDNSRPVRGTKRTFRVLSQSEDNSRPVRGDFQSFVRVRGQW